MSKTLTSPVKRWPGTIILSDPLSMDQVIEFNRAIDNAKLFDSNNQLFEYANALTPGIFACVEKWDLIGLERLIEKKSLPGTPAKDSTLLMSWLIKSITELFNEAEEIPNE